MATATRHPRPGQPPAPSSDDLGPTRLPIVASTFSIAGVIKNPNVWTTAKPPIQRDVSPNSSCEARNVPVRGNAYLYLWCDHYPNDTVWDRFIGGHESARVQ
jgi:hypothetical protein